MTNFHTYMLNIKQGCGVGGLPESVFWSSPSQILGLESESGSHEK